MTQVISGQHKGLRLHVPQGIRPMTEKVRKALFDALGEAVHDAKFLDIFAGSGAVGLEALSLGADTVTWVEANYSGIQAITKNLESIGMLPKTVIQKDAQRFISSTDGEYDIIVADPPYAFMPTLKWENLSKILRNGGIFVLSHSVKDEAPEIAGLELFTKKMYGDTALSYYRQNI